MPKPTIAYLASEYPALTHTFIFREIVKVREAGIEVKTASIKRCGDLNVMTPEERAEAEATMYIKARDKTSIVKDIVGFKIRHPILHLRMVARAFGFALDRKTSWFKSLAYLVEAIVLLQWAKREKVEHIHVHFANPAATVALIAEASGLIAYSLSIHGPTEFFNIERDLIPEKVANATFVRCISNYCRSQLWRIANPHTWDKFHIVHCSVDTTKYTVPAKPHAGKGEVLCVGRLVPAKGQELLIRSCKALKDRGVPCSLTIVGNGPDRTHLEEVATELGITDAVTFTGPVGQGEIQQYYDRATVFALPSFAEGLPVVMMEAMAKGIPCISTFIMGHPELIENGVNGLLVSASDQDALTDGLAMILSDDALRARLAAGCREKVVAEFDASDCGERMAKVFKQYV